jgi:hypothetical protein
MGTGLRCVRPPTQPTLKAIETLIVRNRNQKINGYAEEIRAGIGLVLPNSATPKMSGLCQRRALNR